ncbi:MAG: cell division GTPase FtsZ [Haloarculaceae archaeon]|jgi:cell division GTPase FtsZ
MKLALVGVGKAGSRIVDQIRRRETNTKRTFSRGNVLAFDTGESEYELDAIPHDQSIALGDTHRRVSEAGVEGDVDLAAAVTAEERHDIRRVFDFLTINEVDGVLLVAGLGGGTGGGTGAVLIEELQDLFEKPIYALGVLPSKEEGGRPALNAARSLPSFVRAADNVVLFDNESWSEADAEGPYEQTNRALATRVTSLFAAGELDGTRVAESAIDSSDMTRTLATGGVSAIGYATLESDSGGGGVFSWLSNLFNGTDDEESIGPVEVKRLVRQAVDSRLTLPCNVASAERTLAVLSGPPSKLSRRGFESARYWLEEETDTVEVLAGDEPNARASELTATVLLSNVTDVPRIDALQEQALGHKQTLQTEQH